MRNKKLKIVLSLSVIGLIILLNNPSLRAQVKVKKEEMKRLAKEHIKFLIKLLEKNGYEYK